MEQKSTPTRDILKKHAAYIPEIKPAAIIAMLEIFQAASAIQHTIFDILEKNYQLSKGKLHVMIILHQVREEGITPSSLAETVGVTRATISAMLRRMTRDGLAYSFFDTEDRRGKKICLTEKGQKFMDEILPEHYLRITKLMGKLSEKEQENLIGLLKRIAENG